MSKDYRTSFTPLDEKEEPKLCQGGCGFLLQPEKFGFKYVTRNGVKGKARNSTCLKCRRNDKKIRESNFQEDMTHRVGVLESEVKYLKETLESEVKTRERLQLLVCSLSCSIEELKRS